MNSIFTTLVNTLFNNWTVITKKTYLQPVKVPVVKSSREKGAFFNHN